MDCSEDFFSGKPPCVACGWCGRQHEWVRPGKTQPTCDCDDFCGQHRDTRFEYRTEGSLQGYICPKCWPATP
jgi:hypothetical protein